MAKFNVVDMNGQHFCSIAQFSSFRILPVSTHDP